MPLLYALWTIALLTIIATTTLTSGTTSYKLTRNATEAARQEALAEAAVSRAVLGLIDPRSERRWRVDSTPQQFAFADTTITVAIQDELGRVDLNNADTPLVTAVLRAGGLQTQAASEVADKILDWRDAGSLKRLHGAKAPEYAAAGLAYQPRNGPFQSVEELKLVLGITPKLFARIEPLVTVYSGRPLIDPQFAPAELLAALSGNNQAPGPQGQLGNTPSSRTGIIGANIVLDGRAFSIRVTIGKTKNAREAVVRLTTNPVKPFWLLSWRAIRAD